MIQEDLGRPNFQSPPISTKLDPDRRAHWDDSNGIRFTSNGLYMRKLSHSVLWGQQAKLAKRDATWHHWQGDTWHPYGMDKMTWQMYEPTERQHMARIESELANNVAVRLVQRVVWHVQSATKWKYDSKGEPITGRHMVERDWAIELSKCLWPPWGSTLWPLLHKRSALPLAHKCFMYKVWENNLFKVCIGAKRGWG